MKKGKRKKLAVAEALVESERLEMEKAERLRIKSTALARAASLLLDDSANGLVNEMALDAARDLLQQAVDCRADSYYVRNAVTEHAQNRASDERAAARRKNRPKNMGPLAGRKRLKRRGDAE